MNRRQFIGTTILGSSLLGATGATPYLTSATALHPATPGQPYISARPGKRMGISIASYAIRWKSSDESQNYPAFTNALQVLEHSHKIGSGGVQTGVRGWARDFAGKVRDAREKLDLYLEGQISLPRTEAEADRFEREVRHAKEAGASILRTVCLSGRRYETFKTLQDFQAFKADSMAALERAEPIMRRHKVKLAIENHKDWRITELIGIIEHLGSEWMGITLDVGNNISLLEDPMEVVEKLAPYTFTTHFKDMAVAKYQDGFLLAEVPLREGVIDLQKVVAICEKHNPDVTFNLEMITRDPLKIPCMTDVYWETFNNVNGKDLAQTLRMVQEDPDRPLALVSNKNPEQRLAFEEQNVRSSFAYATANLGLR